MFENTYLVTDKLATFSEAEVDAAEAQLGTRFPEGYREYVTTLGEGEYCSFVMIHSPADIVRNDCGRRIEFSQYAYFWEDGYDVLSKERLSECRQFGSSITLTCSCSTQMHLM